MKVAVLSDVHDNIWVLEALLAELELDGRQVAVTHYPHIGRALAKGDGYDLVCHGHSPSDPRE